MSTIPSSVYGSPPPPTTFIQTLNKIGLGYTIAFALAFLFLLSTFLLSSYLCYRTATTRRRQAQVQAQARNSTTQNSGTYLPRIIFVSEEHDERNDDVFAQHTTVGLDQAVINTYPKFVYTKVNANGGYNRSSDIPRVVKPGECEIFAEFTPSLKDREANDVVCAICLCEYKDSEMLRMLPDCKHYFHLMCVDAWLKLNGSCPVCRNSPLPTPLSTPLSEVVPLSQYSDGRRRV